MAEVIRSAKSGSDWAKNELRAYNINVVPETVATFFGNPNLPPVAIYPDILAHETYPPAGLPKDERLFFDLMEEAMLNPAGEESAVGDFATHLLGMLGYDEPNRYIRRRKDIPFFICSCDTYAKTDVCVIDPNLGVLLLLQEGCYLGPKNPEAQLIAAAIAAFQSNNLQLSRAGLPTLNAKLIPGITMAGTAPTFYKINVTTSLINAVETGDFPAQITTVHKLIPPVAHPLRLLRDGMRPLANRVIILSCFEAFKQFL